MPNPLLWQALECTLPTTRSRQTREEGSGALHLRLIVPFPLPTLHFAVNVIYLLKDLEDTF